MEDIDWHITNLIEAFRTSANKTTDMHLRCSVNNLENRMVKIYDETRRLRRQGAFEADASLYLKPWFEDVAK